MRIFLALISTTFLMVGCGDDDQPASENNTSQNNTSQNNTATPFECLDITCADGDYCHYQLHGFDPYEAHTPKCIPLPTGCTDCDCVETDVRAYYEDNGTNNCDGLVSCSQSNSEVTFICTNPAFDL